MPANLTPQYQKAEEAYRKATGPQEQVACLEEMLKLIPKHKGTEKLQADLKSRLKEAKSEVEAEKKAPKTTRSYRFPRQGAGTIVLVGAPNSGKSRIVRDLTKADVAVADYPFTTTEPAPAMMPWEDAKVQLIDTPPVTESHIEPYLVGMVRSADAVALVFNGASDDAPDEAAAVVRQFADRKTLLDPETGFGDDDYSLLRVRTLLVATRAGDPDCDTRLEFFRDLVPTPFPVQKVEFDAEESGESLRRRLYDLLGVVRVYTKAPGKPADMVDPFTIPHGGTVEDLAAKVHRDLAASLKYGRVWGTSARDGQSVGREHVLADRDVVELHA